MYISVQYYFCVLVVMVFVNRQCVVLCYVVCIFDVVLSSKSGTV